MEKPSLSEVKEYFKNALDIESIYNSKGVYSEKNLYIDNGTYFCKTESGAYLAIWRQQCGYAKILTYKNTEPKFEITKEQIKEIQELSLLCKPDTTVNKLKEWFPEAFETVLEVGNWYKCIEKGFESLARITDLKHNLAYGFSYYGENDKNIWLENADRGWTFNDTKNWIEATTEEVNEALKKEAVRRYKVGNLIKNFEGFFYANHYNNMLFGGEYFCIDSDGSFCVKSTNNFWIKIMNKEGVWATVIPTKTIKEAEELLKELGHEIKIV